MIAPAVQIAGQKQKLGKIIGRGGEGVVYALEGQPEKAVKIYKDELSQSREGKVRAMVDGGLAVTTNLVAFPAEIATDAKGRFTGFVMRLVAGYRPIHELYSPKSRKREFPKADFRFLVRTAQNVARAVATVHKAGCVIGDFNHSGILVSTDATVALIDADSFQFSLNGVSYPCVVGVPEFTPPELQGRSLGAVERTREHDSFGLAVVIFYLLSMGKHPYAGRFSGKDLSLDEAIGQHRFAFSLTRRAQTQTSPPPGSISLDDLPKHVSDAFEAAFGLSPAARPDPAQWVKLLENLEASLSRCGKVATHFYPSAATGCVWCRLTDQSGVEMFPAAFDPNASIPSSGPFDFDRIAAAIRAIKLPPLEEILPKWTGKLEGMSAAVSNAKSERFGQRVFGAIVLAAAIACGFWLPSAVIIWFGIGVFGLVRLLGASINDGPFRQAYTNADKTARAAEEAFLKRIGATEFYSLQQDLERSLTDYKALPSEEARQLAMLRSTREQRQRSAFLDRFLIRRASIAGIGPAKTATLASFGIESADDVTTSAVMAVPGFGPATTAKLVQWRREQEAKFRYNPQPDASDVQAETAVRSAIVAQHIALQSKLNSGVAKLRDAPMRLRNATPDQPLMSALEGLARAERDCLDLGISIPPRVAISFPTQTPAPPSASTSTHRPSPIPPPLRPVNSSSSTPSCPSCGSSMRRRTAHRGARTGRLFWGCSRYPSCHGTRN